MLDIYFYVQIIDTTFISSLMLNNPNLIIPLY